MRALREVDERFDAVDELAAHDRRFDVLEERSTRCLVRSPR